MATLDLLTKANSQNRDIHCFTVDHQLREDAKLEAQFVADFCASRHIKHQTLVWDEDKPSTGIQNAARWARYRLLCKAYEKVGAIGLVTGHNLDDQIETIQMRMLRDKTGEGIGLSGMAAAALFFNSMWVLRPFLGVRKQALKDHLSNASLYWIEDPSNQNELFERVRIRNQADHAISISEIEDAGRARQSLSVLAGSYIRQYCSTNDGLVFEMTIADAEKRTLQKVLEVLVHVIGGRDRSLGRTDIDALYDFAITPGDKRMTMGRVVLNKSGSKIQLDRENRGFSEQRIAPNEEIYWDGRFLIKNTNAEVDIIIGSDGDQNGCPPLVGRLADEEWVSARSCDFASVQPIINKFDKVLPEFDLQLANAIASILDRAVYTTPYDDTKVRFQ
ncbi:MAG: tRNA lysidine(34) synthetase TilS [Rhizobiaceae bacterium]|nr:tRNA lysidine(34) synthetase TilS [Rhizobiaceae bacterium]